MTTTARGIAPLLAGTAVAGIASYLTLWIAFRALGPDEYAPFSVYWGALYFLVGALAGLQSELTRATRPSGDDIPVPPLRQWTVGRFMAIGFVAVGVVVLATSPVWSGPLFRGDPFLVGALALGAGGYVVAALVGGTLSGLSRWTLVGGMAAADAVVRLALVAVAVLTIGGLVPAAWAVAIPFLLVPVLATPLLARSGIRRSQLDVTPARLLRNSGTTIVASGSMALIVSGFPMIIGATTSTDPSLTGAVAFAATLFRAPLIVVFQSVQGIIVVRFRERAIARELGLVFAAVIAATAALAVTLIFMGEWLFELVAGHGVQLSGGFLALLIVSSGLIAMLIVAGAATLAQNHHGAYSASWAVAAIVSVLLMVIPGALEQRVVLASLLGPIAGLLVLGLTTLIRRAG